MNIGIRQERDEDRPKVRKLIEAAFENVAESDHREQELVERLRASKTFIPQLSLVAETDGGTIAGYILLTEVAVVSGEGAVPALGVAPVAVLPELQRRGIGAMLLEEAHRRGARLGYGTAVVLGHPEYYPRFGYRRAADRGIAFPFDAPAECCMVRELRPRASEGLRGTVRYPDEFFM